MEVFAFDVSRLNAGQMKLLKLSILFVVAFAAIKATASAEDVRSPCVSRDPPLSTCSEFAAACIAYFESPKAPNDTLREQMGDMSVKSCVEWKDQCLTTRTWRGPNCVIINIEPR